MAELLARSLAAHSQCNCSLYISQSDAITFPWVHPCRFVSRAAMTAAAAEATRAVTAGICWLLQNLIQRFPASNMSRCMRNALDQRLLLHNTCQHTWHPVSSHAVNTLQACKVYTSSVQHATGPFIPATWATACIRPDGPEVSRCEQPGISDMACRTSLKLPAAPGSPLGIGIPIYG
jgi:hypothetical protein